MRSPKLNQNGKYTVQEMGRLNPQTLICLEWHQSATVFTIIQLVQCRSLIRSDRKLCVQILSHVQHQYSLRLLPRLMSLA